MKYKKIPADTFKQIQLNAGILVDSFDPATQEIGNIIGATTGGVNFNAAPTFSDYGEDIDNCPKNTKELKKLDSIEATMGGTFVTISPAQAKLLVAAGDIDALDATHIVPRNDLLESDFTEIWWVGDYSDMNDGSNAGFCAIKLSNALSTGGFQIQSTDKAKGQFAFTFTGHYSMANPDKVPYDIYIKGSDAEPTPSIVLNTHSVTVEAEGTVTLTATVVPSGTTITWSSASSSVASVAAGVVTAGQSAGSTIITASITVDGVTYSDTCTVIVTEEEGA